MRGRVALAQPRLVAHLLVAAGEGDGLERGPAHLVVVGEAVVEDRPDLLVVDAVHDRHHRRDAHAGRRQVVDRDLAHVEQVRDVAVGVRLVRGPVELQVDHVEPGFLRLEGELGLDREAQAVGRGLDQPVADLLGVGAGLEEVRRHRGLAARVLHHHLPPRLERDRVVQDLLHVVEGELVDVAHLVGVHEARVAHHVAAVGQVHREHRAAAVADARGAVAVDGRVPRACGSRGPGSGARSRGRTRCRSSAGRRRSRGRGRSW